MSERWGDAVRRTFVASFVIVALASAGWFASMGHGDASHKWGKYHWAVTTRPTAAANFTVKLVDSVTGAWDGHLTTASRDWSLSPILDTAVVDGNNTQEVRTACSAVPGQVRVCNAEYGVNGWLGIATIWATWGRYTHITQGTVKNNDSYFNTPPHNTDDWRQFVMCQEIGHTFGLGHQNEVFNNVNTGSCMDYTNNPSGGVLNAFEYGQNNLKPNPHDFDMLASIYNHADGSTTLAAGAASSGAAQGQGAANAADPDPSDAVPAGATARDGRVFVRDLGNGLHVISVVIWAEDFPGADAPGRLVKP